MGQNFDDYPGFQPMRSWANTYAQDCKDWFLISKHIWDSIHISNKVFEQIWNCWPTVPWYSTLAFPCSCSLAGKASKASYFYCALLWATHRAMKPISVFAIDLASIKSIMELRERSIYSIQLVNKDSKGIKE